MPQAMDRAAGFALIFGETIGGLVFPPSFTFLRLTPVFWFGLVLLVARHIIYRRPSLPEVIFQWMRKSLPRLGWPLALALATRLAIFVVGAVTVTVVGLTLKPFQFRVSHNEIQNLPARFDAGWYLNIARHGYRWTEEKIHKQQNIAFFPLYPTLMRVGGDVLTIPAKLTAQPEMLGGGDARVLWGGVLVSVVCFTIALARLQELAQLVAGTSAAARLAVALQALYPFAFFFGQAYSEAVFLLTAVAMTLAWKQGRFLAAFAWGLAAGLTRSNAWTLTAAFVLDALVASRPKSRAWQVAAAFAPLSGAVLFTSYIWQLTGHPLAWVQAQEAWTGPLQPLSFITSRIELIGMRGAWAYVRADPVDFFTVLGLVLSAVGAVLLFRRREWLLASVICAYLAPAVLLDMTALGRMTSVLFPIFIAFAAPMSAMRTKWLATVTASLFILCQWYLAARFFRWLTPF